MKKWVSPRIAAILLLAAAVMIFGSVYSFTLLDHVVHSDLYRYGLTFDLEWATEYWTYSRLMISSLSTSVLMLVASVILILKRRKGWHEGPRSLVYLCLLAGFVTAGFSTFLFTRLDGVVHGDLYRYGLDFDAEWALKYWNYSYLVLGLIGFSMATMIVSSTTIRPRIGTRGRVTKYEVVSYALLCLGFIGLVVSILYEVSILAFVGLGLVFWGALLFYIRPGRYVKEELLIKTVLPQLENLEHILGEIGYNGKGVYLPPKYLESVSSSRVYLGATERNKLPSPEEIQNRKGRMFLESSALVTPPGGELVNLFEDKLGTSFTRVNLQQLQQNIQRLLVEELEIAQKVRMRHQGNRVQVKVQSVTYQKLWQEAERFPKVWNSLGCPITSAIACAITRATGRPLIIEDGQLDRQGQILNVKYSLV